MLAGRTPKVGLDESGTQQARDLVARLQGVDLADVVRSPLLRCGETLAPLLRARGMHARREKGFTEVDYGDWTGRELSTLGKEKLWKVVQAHPSAAVFPGGEGLAAMQARAVSAIRTHDARVTAEHGEHAVWLLCSHGDVIKSVLADALGMHLDSFQRIVVDPCSVSVVRYTDTRPFVLRMNERGGDVASVVPPRPKRGKRRRSGSGSRRGSGGDAVVGGTA